MFSYVEEISIGRESWAETPAGLWSERLALFLWRFLKCVGVEQGPGDEVGLIKADWHSHFSWHWHTSTTLRGVRTSQPPAAQLGPSTIHTSAFLCPVSIQLLPLCPHLSSPCLLSFCTFAYIFFDLASSFYFCNS